MRHGTGTILVIEDDPNDARVIRNTLAEVSPQSKVVVVGDVDEAFRYLTRDGSGSEFQRSPTPSLVILDLGLPRKSGLTFLEWLRGQESLAGLPTIVLTGSESPDHVARAYALGAKSYLVKSASLPEFAETVRWVARYWLRLNQFREV
jgi:DNA-binding response OmpR family regulator